jgi:predicted aspartyl protease
LGSLRAAPFSRDAQMDYKFDVALSFAGEQRSDVEQVADRLKNAGLRVFYDAHEKASLWGKDLYVHLSDVYQNRARYCIIFASKEYADKSWTSHERQSAQARALREKGNEYILPVRFDDTEVPGLPRTVGYLDFRLEGAEGISKAFIQKLTSRQQPHPVGGVTYTADELQKEGLRLRISISAPQMHMREDELAGLEYGVLNVLALIDTGATRTLINPQVAEICRLRQTGNIYLTAVASGPSPYPEYAASIAFPGIGLKAFETIPVVACELPRQSISCLIGRDLMRRWKFTYDGGTGEFTITD